MSLSLSMHSCFSSSIGLCITMADSCISTGVWYMGSLFSMGCNLAIDLINVLNITCFPAGMHQRSTQLVLPHVAEVGGPQIGCIVAVTSMRWLAITSRNVPPMPVSVWLKGGICEICPLP